MNAPTAADSFAPTFSIVTPSRNQASFIDETIESVLAQEGDFAIDYIVVDGASTDDSVANIRKHEARLVGKSFPIRCRNIRFRWLSEPDQGQSDALGKGFRLATGELVAWLNSDDTYLPGALQKVRDVFAHHPAHDVVYGRSHYIDVRGARLGDYPTEPFDRRRLAVTNFICQPSTFFRRATLERAGYPDGRLHFAMDYDLWIRMARDARFFYLDEPLSRYRLHDDSKTVSEKHALDNAREVLEVVRKHFDWAPANRVYAFYSRWYEARMALRLLKKPPIAACVVSPLAFIAYCAMNRGIRLDDLKWLSIDKLRTLLTGQRLH
jgi:glycosyltransferase involved in cell wall biosynthesis